MNIASQASVTVRVLRDIGVDARGLIWGNTGIQDPSGLRVYEAPGWGRHPFRYFTQRVGFLRELRASIRWADVIHYHCLLPAVSRSRDLRWVARSDKPRIVEVWGSDIRKRDVAAADNPYLTRYLAANPSRGVGSEKSRERQQEFARYGFDLLVPGRELLAYVEPDLFPNVYNTAACVIASNFEPEYPSTNGGRPLIVHSPSSPELKGTAAVLAAVDQLRLSCDFEFKLLHKVPHGEALDIVRKCDIFVDQFVLGGYGLASIEAMAFGKPVVCYIKDPTHYPPDLPVVNATQDMLPAVLESLLADPKRRQEIGRRSRAYVERYHDARQVTQELVAIYHELIVRANGRRNGVGR